MDSVFENPRERLISLLRGSSITIPNLREAIQHWPSEVNPEMERLEKDVNERLRWLFPEADRLRKMKATNFALFAASWWPYAAFEKLRTATFLAMWLFYWDDETDSKEFSSLAADRVLAQAFFSDTLDVIRKSLPITTKKEHSAMAYSNNPLITSFGQVGNSVALSCTEEQTKRLLEQLVYFVEMTDVEQQFQTEKRLPSVEEYMTYRMGSSAVGVCLAVTEYCFDMEIPPSVMRENDLRVVWNETNVIISIMNDIISVKKEIAQGQANTLIPLLFLRHGSLQAAIDIAMETTHTSIKSFELSAERLLAQYNKDPVVHEKLQKFIHGCKCACTANIEWSLSCGRYKLDRKAVSEGVPIIL